MLFSLIPSTATKLSDDPLCKLDAQQKLRICSLVMSSSFFAKSYRVGGNTNYIFDRCREKRVSFRTEYGKGKKEIYKEWMIICKGRRRKSLESVSFHLSRAYVSHTVIVYTTTSYSPASLYPETITTDVRGLVDVG